jgi:hypothetical protein
MPRKIGGQGTREGQDRIGDVREASQDSRIGTASRQGQDKGIEYVQAPVYQSSQRAGELA